MSNQNINQIYQSIIAKLSVMRRTWRWLIFSDSLLRWVSILAILMTAVLLILYLPLPRLFRSGIAVISLGIACYMTYRLPVLSQLRKFSHTKVAAYLEKSYPNIENRILSAVQLKLTLENNRLGYAQEFVEQLIQQTHTDIAKIERKKIFQSEFRKIKRSAVIAVIAVGILALTNFLLPTALKGFSQTYQALPKTPLEGFTVQIEEVRPGNIKIKRGEDVTISTKVSGHLDAPVYVYYRLVHIDEAKADQNSDTEQNVETTANQLPHLVEKEKWRSILMKREATEISYSAKVENIDRSLQYYVSTKDKSSERFQIAVSHEPIVKTFQLQLNFPTYTQLPSQTLETNTGDAEVLYGTEIVLIGESNKPLSEAHLIFEDSDLIKLKVNAETGIEGSFIAERAGTYHIQIQDSEGLVNMDPLVYTLNVYKDSPPHVEIVEPGKDLVLDNAMLVKLKVEATDDYGIQALQLVHRLQKENSDDRIITLKQIPPRTSPPHTSQFIAYTWDINPIGLFPGDILSYYVQVLDIDDVSGPNIGKSPTYTLRFPTLDELYEELASEQEAEQYGLDELFDEQSEATGIVDQLLDKIRKFKEFSHSD